MENNIKEKQQERNYGIDLLRVVSMFFVVILHNLGHGKILENAAAGSIQYNFAWAMEIFAYCAVNVFALISGYVSYSDEEKEYKLSNYIKLWLEVVFYGLIITLFFNIYNPSLVSKSDYFISLLPVTNGLYWYFTAYTALFAIMPFINNGIRKCSKNTLKKLFIVIIVVFAIFDVVVARFATNAGYSFVWIMLLYILGAIIKKCDIGKNLKWYKALIGIIILLLISWLYKIFGFEISKMNVKITKDLLVSYTSPTILGISILYLILFSKFKFNNIINKIIKFLSVSAFSVYILNNNRLIWNNILDGLFAGIANNSIAKIFIYVVGFAFLFTITSILIDKIRLFIFKILHINEFANKISNLIKNGFNKITDLLFKLDKE